MSLKQLWVLAGVSVAATGCFKGPTAPFDTLESANVVAFRLQNYEAPAQQQQQGAQLPGVPTEIQAWAQQALPALQQMIPPGLLPPGVIPGTLAPQAQPQQQAANRFHGFPILEQQFVSDPDLKEDLADLLGDDDSYQQAHAGCMYAEMGLSFASSAGAPPNDVLVSFSCNQMQGHNFVWPYPDSGMKPNTVKKLADIVSQLFPPRAAVPLAQPVGLNLRHGGFLLGSATAANNSQMLTVHL